MCKTSKQPFSFFLLRKHANGHVKADIRNCRCMSSFAEQFKEEYLNVKVREDTRHK